MAVSFLKQGQASVLAAQQEEAAAEARKEEMGKLWRFWMKIGEKGVRITFVDGDLDKDGFLVPPRYFEHSPMINGKVEHYVCPEKSNPASGEICPICASGDRPALVAAFTVIDHREFKSTKEDGKIHKDRPKLLIAKGQSFELLAQIAQKRGGLAGCTFEVSRIGEKSAQIGSMFDFEQKTPIAVLMDLYTYVTKDPKTNAESTVCNFVPADYESEIIYRSGDQLRKLGYWGSNMTQTSPVASASKPAGPSAETAKKYAEEL